MPQQSPYSTVPGEIVPGIAADATTAAVPIVLYAKAAAIELVVVVVLHSEVNVSFGTVLEGLTHFASCRVINSGNQLNIKYGKRLNL
jgi:hypothetical protein